MNENNEILDGASVLFGSYYKLAKHLQVSTSTIYRWRDGKVAVPAAVLILLQGYLDHPARVRQDEKKQNKKKPAKDS